MFFHKVAEMATICSFPIGLLPFLFEQTAYGLNISFSQDNFVQVFIFFLEMLKKKQSSSGHSSVIVTTCGLRESRDTPNGKYVYIVCETGPWCRACLTQPDRWLLVGILMSLVKAEECIRTVSFLYNQHVPVNGNYETQL